MKTSLGVTSLNQIKPSGDAAEESVGSISSPSPAVREKLDLTMPEMKLNQSMNIANQINNRSMSFNSINNGEKLYQKGMIIRERKEKYLQDMRFLQRE